MTSSRNDLIHYPASYKKCNSLLIARDLEGYISGNKPCTPPTVPDGDSSFTISSYYIWILHSLYFAHLGSCDAEASVFMEATSTSCDAWYALECVASSHSHSKIMSLKERLNSSSIGASSVNISNINSDVTYKIKND